MASERLDRAIDELRAESERAFDDLAEQRVLRAVLERRKEAPAPRRLEGRVFALAAIAIAAAAAIAIGLGSGPERVATSEHEEPRAAERTAPVPAPEPPSPSRLLLDDGSRIELAPSAEVRVVQDARDGVRIEQSAGDATYHVRPDPARAFVVATALAEVTVRGTVFRVHVDEQATSVDVTEGAVDVSSDGRHTLLHSGEGVRFRAPSEDSPRPPEPPPHPVERAPRASEPGPAAPEPSALLERVNEARRSGRLDEAAVLLDEVIATSPTEAGRASALMTLGRVERARGRVAEAARAFDRCAAAPTALAEGALASAAKAWNDAGDPDAAAARARRYLERWPSGVHAPAMRALVR
jgi:transmembrane sensor